MTRTFRSFGAFAAHLVKREVPVQVELHKALERAGAAIEKSAKEEIGQYQPEVGPFPAWAPLAKATKDDRVAQGYPADEPLLREGDMRDSISHQVGFAEVVVGSTSKVAVYQELGTDKIPPRPFLGPAVVHNEARIVADLGAAVVRGLVGGKAIETVEGYDRAIRADDT